MNALIVAGIFAMASSAAVFGVVLLRTRARLTGILLVLGAVLLAVSPVFASSHPAIEAFLLKAAAALCFSLALLAYPTPDWRHPVGFAAWVASAAAGVMLTVGSQDQSSVLAFGSVLLVSVFGNLLLRYERAPEADRHAALWWSLSVIGAGILHGHSIFLVPPSHALAIGLPLYALVPPALVVGVTRPDVLDVRGVIAQAAVFEVLVVSYVAVFVGTTSVFELLGVADAPVGVLAIVGAVAAAGFHPLRVRLRHAIDELLFGYRPDPLDAATKVAAEIGHDPARALDAVRNALVLPYASLHVDGKEVACSGTPVPHTRRLSLALGDDTAELVGEIVVGLRSGDLGLSAADERVLSIVGPLLAQTLRARSLVSELQNARGNVITAIEDERRRLRRDLHDGLGPTLSGIAFTADAARNSLADLGAVDDLLRNLRADAVGAIAEVRRLVDGMRPPALDELGLVAALRVFALQVRIADGRPLLADIHAPRDLGALPAAVEVAAYRITVEALTNVARHSGCDRVAVDLGLANGDLVIDVLDQGQRRTPWAPGVGLASMRERAAEIGGTIAARTTPDGGHVRAVLPVP